MKRAKRELQPTTKLQVQSTKQTKITKNGGKLKKTFITAESRQGTELIVTNNNTNETDTCEFCNQKIENDRLESADGVINSLDSQPEKEQGNFINKIILLFLLMRVFYPKRSSSYLIFSLTY